MYIIFKLANTWLHDTTSLIRTRDGYAQAKRRFLCAVDASFKANKNRSLAKPVFVASYFTRISAR